MDDYDKELYFSMKYSDDIVDLFMKFKEIMKQNNLSILENKSTAYDLEYFLLNELSVADPYIDSESDEENNLDNTIDELQ